MNKIIPNTHNERPLYNIRILKSYMDYIRKNYPNANHDKILDYAGVSKLQLNDTGYWYSQNQANRFHEILVQETGCNSIAKDAGRQLLSSQNLFAQYLLNFKDPGSVARGFAKIYSKGSLGAKAKAKKINDQKYEMTVTPELGVEEQYFQCENRIGIFEGIFNYITYENPLIEHPECIHKGGDCCRYLVSFKKTSNVFRWLRIRNNLILLGIFIPFSTYFFLSFNYFLIIFLFFVSVVFFVNQKVQKLEKGRLTKNIEELGKTAEELWNELNIRYSSTKLVQEVGEITSVIQNEQEISASVATVMSKRLDYGRGLILLAKNNTRSLFYAGGYGFTEGEISIMNNAQLRIQDRVTEGILNNIFINQEPAFIDGITQIMPAFDKDNSSVSPKTNLQAMICVPIVHEGESLGVMAVDNLRPERTLREGDINLLMAVASQTAVSIANARAFQKLQESEKKHRTLVETVQDIVYTLDLEGRFSYVSPMVEVLTGYKDEELLGRKFIEIVAPADKKRVLQKFSAGLDSGGTSTYEIKILTKDSRSLPVELNVAPLTDTKGQSAGRIGVARDVTRRYREEAKRQEMEMRALTQDKLASLGEIATGIAHEINQPLSYIKIILESTLDDVAAEKLDQGELSEDFTESLRQVGKISNIISHLRTFGRSDVTSFSPVKLTSVLNDTLILMNERLRIKNISFEIQMKDNLPMLHGNHVKLEQVFINLIQNSMDAMEEQGKGDIVLSAQKQDDHIMIIYSDTGIGIAPELHEKIFDPFFTTKEAGKGTGIGLSIVYGIIQEHDGAITCESEEGNGATFKISLPAYPEEKADSSSIPLHA